MTDHTTATSPPRAGGATTEELWWRLSADLRRFIARRVDPSDVDDVLQTVFLRLHAELGRVRDDDRLLAWVFTVTRNVITDHHRRASRRREVAVAEHPPSDHPLTQDDAETEAGHESAEAELAACLQPMLASLPPEQAAALELVEMRGLSQVEAARLAEVTTSGMKSRVQRGRAHLRDVLLDCCAIERDVRGRVRDWAPRTDSSGPDPCGCP